ncbi:hypothetical protein PCIT_a0917 [Pseudoalteromonas citrea]|uniref:Uncharacterized protein n=2 Tax=Pseudoalteromonas citrea TaxID=43655 RepID=A0AAD4ALG0_9GAMM|nr:hypothetical protein [Pseudoalteromonas citrea]KAF7774468.1 hypothetical protein PCIT_a0917 [Pseudoalteromonas citrea]
MKETALNQTQMLICQRLFTRAATLVNRPGWRQAMSINSAAETLTLCSGAQPNLLNDVLSRLPLSHSHYQLWMVLAIPLTMYDIEQLKSHGINRIYALSHWFNESQMQMSIKLAAQQGITYSVLPDPLCERLNFGRNHLMKRLRPWYLNSQSITAQGHIEPVLAADKGGYFRHFLQRFDNCILPWEYRHTIATSSLNIMFERSQSSHISLVDSEGKTMLDIAATLTPAEQAAALNNFHVNQDYGEVCLDGALTLSHILGSQNMVDESQQALQSEGEQTKYDVIGQSILQTTTFTPENAFYTSIDK